MAVVEVLKWAEPHAWEDDDDEDGQPLLVCATSSSPEVC